MHVLVLRIMDTSSRQLPIDRDKRSELPCSITDAAREERLQRRRGHERAHGASKRVEEKDARFVDILRLNVYEHLLNVACVYLTEERDRARCRTRNTEARLQHDREWHRETQFAERLDPC